MFHGLAFLCYSAGSSSQPIWLDAVNCYSTYSCLAYCESCPSSQVSACTHSEDVALGCGKCNLSVLSMIYCN